MFDITGIMLVCVLFPLLGAILVPVAGRFGGDSGKTALLTAAITFVAAFFAAYYTRFGITADWMLPMPLGMDLHLAGGSMEAFMAATSSFLSFIIMYYSQGYIEKGPYKTEFYTAAMLFLGAMMGLIFSSNLVWIFVFWEITAICSWRLVGYFRAKTDILKANKTFREAFMIKGVNKNVVIVKGKHGDIFESAIFIVKPEINKFYGCLRTEYNGKVSVIGLKHPAL